MCVGEDVTDAEASGNRELKVELGDVHVLYR